MDVVRKFSGASGEDLEQWLDRFEVAVDLTGESTQEEKEKTAGRLIPLFLDGAAYSTWKQIPTGRNDLDTVKTALRRVLGKSLATAWRELKELRLLPGQSVDVLAEEAKRLLGIIVGNDSPPQQVVSLALIDALPRTIADQVRHGQEGGQPLPTMRENRSSHQFSVGQWAYHSYKNLGAVGY